MEPSENVMKTAGAATVMDNGISSGKKDLSLKALAGAYKSAAYAVKDELATEGDIISDTADTVRDKLGLPSDEKSEGKSSDASKVKDVYANLEVRTGGESSKDYFSMYDSDGNKIGGFGSDAKVGDTMEACGGTVTYKGKGAYGATVDVDDKDTWHSNDYIALTDEQRGTLLHYDGELGSFDFNTRDFALGYAGTDGDDGKTRVPCLKYVGDKTQKVLGSELFSFDTGITDGRNIKIPDGLTRADYMFDGSAITSRPDIPSSVVSDKNMFANCDNINGKSDEKSINETRTQQAANLIDSLAETASAKEEVYGAD